MPNVGPLSRAMTVLVLCLVWGAALGAQDTPSAANPSNSAKKKDPDQIGNREVDKGINFYSIEREMALGKVLAKEMERTSQIVDDAVISEYVNRVGQNLALNSDAKMPLTIKVIRDDEVNAVSLPGGFLFVNTGLLLAADTESELAGAMAHEIAHVAARHATRQATQARLAGLATIPLIPLGGWAGVGGRTGASAAGRLVGLGFSREFEAEADLLGLEYMYKAGYDPNGFVNIFEKILALDSRRPGAVAKLFLTHPPTSERIETVQKNIQNLLKAQPQYVVDTSEFDSLKARLQALENPSKPRPPSLYPPIPADATRPADRKLG